MSNSLEPLGLDALWTRMLSSSYWSHTLYGRPGCWHQCQWNQSRNILQLPT